MDDRNNQGEERSFQSTGYGTSTGNQSPSGNDGGNANNQPPKEG